MPDYIIIALMMSIFGVGIAIAGIIVDVITNIKLKQYGMTREELEE